MSHAGFISAETVRRREQRHTTNGFLLKFLLVGCVVKIEVAAEDLVRSFTGENDLYTMETLKSINLYLDSQVGDIFRQEVHRSRGTNGGNVIGLQVPDELLEDGDALLEI